MEKLKKKLEELEKQRQEIEFTYHQVIGSIKTVNSLIEEYKKDDKKK